MKELGVNWAAILHRTADAENEILDYLQETKEHEIIIYEFHFPIDLCGRLIGRQGVHVDYIRQMTLS